MGKKCVNLLNNARHELVTLHFNKVKPTSQSNRGCLGLCSCTLKRSSDALKESDLQGPAPSPNQPIRTQFGPFHFSLKGPEWTTGSHAPRSHPSPRPSSIWTSIMHHKLPSLPGSLPLEPLAPTP